MTKMLNLFLILCCTLWPSHNCSAEGFVPTIYDFTVKTIDGKDQSLADFKGKTILIVNTASHCGHTPQYRSLETLYKQYKDQGFVVLAFPENNFKNQEPGTNADIKEFCDLKYHVTFPLFSKISVKGETMAPLYRYLTTQSGFYGPITWNFNKFLVSPEGQLVARFDSKIDPLDPQVIAAIKKSLPAAGTSLKSQLVEYKQGDAILEGYLVYDDTLQLKRPGILVVHEWKGLNDYAKMRANMLAQLGYVAFAADIYGKGIRPQTFEGAGAMAGKFKADRALLRARVSAGLDVLRSQANVDASQLAAIGYCFGGTAVLELARSGVNIKGVVSFHGGLSSPTPKDAQNIKSKILALHGAADPFVKPDEVAGFEKEMTDAKVNYQLIKYPGAMHGFTNPDNKNLPPGALYNEAADKASWKEMQKFFKEIFK